VVGRVIPGVTAGNFTNVVSYADKMVILGNFALKKRPLRRSLGLGDIVISVVVRTMVKHVKVSPLYLHLRRLQRTLLIQGVRNL